MNLVERQTAELEIQELNWLLANLVYPGAIPKSTAPHPIEMLDCLTLDTFVYSPSTDWEQCGQLIEKYSVSLMSPHSSPCSVWHASLIHPDYMEFTHPTNPLIAACRAIVASVLGNTVQVPEELVP